MTSVIAYYLLLQLLLRAFFKTDNSIFYCGIAAVSTYKNLTPDQEKVVMLKMKILGLYNQTRGLHSCGIYINNRIFKGFDNLMTKKDTKLFHNFISDKDWIMPHFNSNESSSIILHTRQATTGAHVEANAHPFLIENEDPKKSIVGVHNGNIENIWDLCNKYGMKHVDYHVDSKALYALISMYGVEEILPKYKGYAALVFTKPSEPDSMYVFRGASRKVKDQDLFEERPLMYMKTEEGIYFSSLENSLLAIRDSEDQIPTDVDGNQVIKVTRGKFTNSRKTIERKDANIYIPSKREDYVKPSNFFSNTKPENRTLTKKEVVIANAPLTSKIWSETQPPRGENTKPRVFFHKGRYWLGGLLLQGEHYLNHKGYVDAKEEHDTRPYYFWAGVQLIGEQQFKELENLSKDKTSWLNIQSSNFAFCISKYSAHPVTNLPSDFIEGKESEVGYWRFAFYKDGHRCNENFSPKFSSRTYIIDKKAFLIDITSSDKSGDKHFFEGEENKNAPFQGGTQISRKSIISRRGKDDSCFDAVFDTVQEALGSIDGIEKRALISYCEEQLKVQSVLDPTEDEVDAYFLQAIREAVEKNETLRIILNDTTSTLEMYAEIILDEEKKLAPSKNATEQELNLWEEEFYGRNGFYPKHTDFFPVVDAEANFHKDDSHTCQQCEIIEKSIVDDGSIHSQYEISIEMAQEKVDLAIDQLAMLIETAEELKSNDSDLGQESANVIIKHVEMCKVELSEVLTKHGFSEEVHKLNKRVNIDL